MSNGTTPPIIGPTIPEPQISNDTYSVNKIITIGLNGSSGQLLVNNGEAKTTVQLNGDNSTLLLHHADGDGNISINGVAGKIGVGWDSTKRCYTINLDGESGSVEIKNRSSQSYISLNEFGITVGDKNGVARFSVYNSTGEIVLRDGFNMTRVIMRSSTGEFFLCDENADPKVIMKSSGGGDILVGGGDCAEEFDIASDEPAEPGMVMVIDNEGELRASAQAYDKRVAGVISGAGDLRPGITLGRQQARANRLPLALTGKVYCKVDAEFSSIEVGDLLTTSPTIGHAMKVSDPLMAFGSVIGKALSPLKNGKGIIPILIALQ